ncbi:MAG: Rv3235 family protein [Dermabacter sp.]|nr:Rv3235 family protein [Dermabacter sp.]
MNTHDAAADSPREQGPGPFAETSRAERIIRTVARQALEVINGYRPHTSLHPILVLEERERLRSRAALIATHRTATGCQVAPRIHVGGINICHVNDTVMETTAIVRDSLRARFICMRWELRHSGWRITVLEFG